MGNLDKMVEQLINFSNEVYDMAVIMGKLFAECWGYEYIWTPTAEVPSFIKYARSLVPKHRKEKPNVTKKYINSVPNHVPYTLRIY